MRASWTEGSVLATLAVTLLALVALPITAAPGNEFEPGGLSDPDGSARAPGTSPAYAYAEATRAQFDLLMSSQATQGKSLVDVEVRWNGSQELFTAVWFPVSGTIHTLIQGTTADWTAFHTSMELLASRFLDVEVAYFDGVKKYSAIFYEDGDDYNFALHTSSTDAGFQAYLDTYQRQGLSIIDFEAYRLPTGYTRFAGVWVDDPNQPPTHLLYNLESADVSALLRPMQGRVIDVERYYSSLHNEDRFAVILAVLPGGGWGHYREQTWSQIIDLNTTISNGSTHLIDLDPVVTKSGAVRFNAVWGSGYKSLNEVDAMPALTDPEPLTPELSALVTEFETTLGVGTVGLYAKNLRTNQSIGYRENEMFYLASATKTAIHIKFWRDVEAGRFGPADLLAYTSSADTGSPWYVDERPNPGFASGAPGFANDLGRSYQLNRFDQAMMSVSDNGATSALVLDPDIGAAYAAQDLTEWLASEPGIGKGWGIVTAIQDADRHILWQSQQSSDFVGDPSYFLMPRFALGPFMRGSWKVCTVGGVLPTDCVGAVCTRCVPNIPGNCPAGESCKVHGDPWGAMADFLGLSAGQAPPGKDYDVGYPRYYASGLNAATPRAVGNLWEGLVENRFLTPATTATAMANMNEWTPFSAGPNLPGHVDIVAKGGSKRNVCTDTGVYSYGSEKIVVSVLTKDLTRECADGAVNNDVRDIYMPRFGDGLLFALGADLEVIDPVADSAVAPVEVRPGENLVGVVIVTNTTGGDAGPVNVRLSLSTNQNITIGDPAIGDLETDLIPGHGSQMLVKGGPLPTLSPGLYYFGWIVDKDGELPELNESNKGFNPTPIRVKAPLVEITDLRFTAKTTAEWTENPDTAFYRIHEGTSSTLPQLLDGTPDSCQLEPAALPVSSGFVTTPPPGALYWYLVQAEVGGPILPSSVGPRSVNSTGECGASCAHPKCEIGEVLDPLCDKCAGRVCEYDSYCCNTMWDSLCVDHVRTVCNSLICDASTGACDHNVCIIGPVLVPGCDDPPVSPSCVEAVCSRDPYCCATLWDSLCVEEVVDYCGATCE